jgi:hypothetical protein
MTVSSTSRRTAFGRTRWKRSASATPLVLRGRTEGTNPVYYVLGPTYAGRHLFCVVIQFPDGKGYPVTARPMTDKEQRRFSRWKNR